MASTNHTTNYNLSQFIGTDKPTWLGDYNGDMGKIDAQMKTNADNIATAITASENATTTANSAVSTANSASATASSASTTADNAQSTANSALSTATTANTNAQNAQASAEAVASKLNLTNFETINVNNITKTGNGNISACYLFTATNGDGSIGKIYGRIKIDCNGSGGTITIPTQLRPKDSSGNPTDIDVNGVAIRAVGENGNVKNVENQTITIRSNGNVEIAYGFVYAANDYNLVTLVACILFLTPFNDEPMPNNN